MYTGVSLADFLRQIVGSQQSFAELAKQEEALGKQAGTPQSTQSLQQATTSSQPPKVIRQLFPVFDRGTQEVAINPLTGEIYVPPKVFPSSSEASQTATQKTASVKPKSTQKATVKKPLTAGTIEQTAGVQSPIPVLPYTPEGLLSALSQGKINLAQAQQALKNLAQQDLSAENFYDTIAKQIQSLPKNVKNELQSIEGEMEKVFDRIEQNLNEQVKITQKYADEQIKLLRQHLNYITNVFTDLMKEKPNLEPDKWTEFGRRLAMALGAISAMAHPGYAPYFYMAIPQVVQYWHIEDMQNFEKAMKKFELALQLAGTQLDFYNQIMEHSLAILGMQKEKDLLPLTLTGQLLMEKYHTYSDTYTKLFVESMKIINDSIGNLLKLQELKIKEKHNEDWAKIQELAKAIMLERLRLDEWYRKQSIAIRKTLASIAGKNLQLRELKALHPELVPETYFKEVLKKTKSPEDVVAFLKAIGVPVEKIEKLEKYLQTRPKDDNLTF